MSLEVELAAQKKDICYMKKAIDEIKVEVKATHLRMDDFIDAADKRYAKQSDHEFWRNILVSGIILTIFIDVILRYLST